MLSDDDFDFIWDDAKMFYRRYIYAVKYIVMPLSLRFETYWPRFMAMFSNYKLCYKGK